MMTQTTTIKTTPTLSAFIGRTVAFAFLLVTLGMMSSACGPSLQSLKTRENDMNRERSEIKGLRNAKESARSYHQHLKSGQGKALLISKQDIVQAFSRTPPRTDF